MTGGSADDFADATVLLQQSYADDDGLAVGDEIEVTTPTGTPDLAGGRRSSRTTR